MKTSEAFRRVAEVIKKDVERGYAQGDYCSHFICVELRFLADRTNKPGAYLRARKHIENAISPSFTLDDWVEENVLGYAPTTEDVNQFRLRWLDHLIKEFEAKGD